MDRVTLKNFRCFGEQQSVRLAPLTLLVGDNSTGKSSFLAMLRILAELESGSATPEFKREPFDLGSFDEVAHMHASGNHRATEFLLGFEDLSNIRRPNMVGKFTFRRRGSMPSLVERFTGDGHGAWILEQIESDGIYTVQAGTQNGTWKVQSDELLRDEIPSSDLLAYVLKRGFEGEFEAYDGPAMVGDDDVRRLNSLPPAAWFHLPGIMPHAGAPLRAKPHRTYDPDRADPDPEGKYVPFYLAQLARSDSSDWDHLKRQIEHFGTSAQLFDEIRIRELGTNESDPFQIQVRKGSEPGEGSFKNLVDVGYGISQVLPLTVELLRPQAPWRFLLQQPEIHLHPMAQAALGTLFCHVAADDHQLVVETHSDHLIDRVRMDIRDGRTGLTPDDVRILYFERDELDVKIHELWWDENGNIQNAPESYRRFFMEEVERSIWPPD